MTPRQRENRGRPFAVKHLSFSFLFDLGKIVVADFVLFAATILFRIIISHALRRSSSQNRCTRFDP